MRKAVLGLLTAGFLLGAAVASQAQDIKYTLLDDTAWTTTGVTGSGSDASITNILFDPIPNPFIYSTPSVVKFGDDFTTPGLGMKNTSTTFTNKFVDFNFMLAGDLGPAHTLHAEGLINGSLGYGSTGAGFSNAKITFTSITDTFNGNTSVASIDPNNGLAALEIQTVVGGNAVNLYLDTTQSKPAPNLTLSTSGFLTAQAVPEGGTWTLLAGSCVTGGVFLLRKRRRS